MQTALPLEVAIGKTSKLSLSLENEMRNPNFHVSFMFYILKLGKEVGELILASFESSNYISQYLSLEVILVYLTVSHKPTKRSEKCTIFVGWVTSVLNKWVKVT